jgi:hypothetical protein
MTAFDPKDTSTFPLVLTVPEFAACIRTGDTAAYSLVRAQEEAGDDAVLRIVRTSDRGSIRLTRDSVLRFLGADT